MLTARRRRRACSCGRAPACVGVSPVFRVSDPSILPCAWSDAWWAKLRDLPRGGDRGRFAGANEPGCKRERDMDTSKGVFSQSIAQRAFVPAGAIMFLGAGALARADPSPHTFSVDRLSPSPVDPADVLNPGEPPPSTQVPAANLGLQLGDIGSPGRQHGGHLHHHFQRFKWRAVCSGESAPAAGRQRGRPGGAGARTGLSDAAARGSGSRRSSEAVMSQLPDLPA